MPLNSPEIADIILAVRECLQDQVLPECEDAALNLNVRICMSLLRTVERELQAGDDFVLKERTLLTDLLLELEPEKRSAIVIMDNQQLNMTLEQYLVLHPQASSDARIVNTLYQITLAKLAIDNPRYPAYQNLLES